jgi:diguanylate cyclase (GGDEF)-like protein
METMLRGACGTLLPVRISLSRIELAANLAFCAVVTDLTASARAVEELRHESQARQRVETILSEVLDALPAAVSAYDDAQKLILVNRAHGNMFSFAQADSLAALNGPAGGEGFSHAAQDTRPLVQPQTLDLPDGRTVQAQHTRTKGGLLVSVCTDVTELKRAEGQLRLQAESDELTGLASRRAFLSVLESVLSRPGRGFHGALVLFDIDYFKQVNDTLGHDAGDDLLIKVAQRLKSLVRSGDFVARLGGDEFTLLLFDIDDEKHLRNRMAAILEGLAAPATVGGKRFHITVSAGVARIPHDGRTVKPLLKSADLALYEAKRAGRARWQLFHPSRPWR